MTSQKKYRLISLAATLLIAGGTVAFTILCRLGFSVAAGREWPPADTSGVLMADEYVEVEPIAPLSPKSSTGGDEDGSMAQPPPDAQDFTNSGPASEEIPPVVTSKQPSPVKATERYPEKPTGPTEEELAAQAAAKRQAEAAAEARNRMKFGTGGSGRSTGIGPEGEGSGMSKGRTRGSGRGSLGGRKVTVAGNVDCQQGGTVTVSIVVDPEGRILEARAVSAKSTIKEASVLRACERDALQSRAEKAPAGVTENQSGTIVYRFN